jgi:hypothetical protein
MNYLQPSEYVAYGLDATTPAALVAAASTLIDSHCRRASLAVTQYEERIRLMTGRNTVRVSYVPLVAVAPATTAIVSARGRFAIPRRGDWPLDDLNSDVALLFGLPGTWTDVMASGIDVYAETGELTLPVNAIGLGFSELDVVYTAGWNVIPDAVKFACAQLTRNAQATPALNVQSGQIDSMHLQYFGDSLIDQTVRTLLAPYVAQKVG